MTEQTSRYRASRNEAESLRMMADPDRWPQWPLLPLKRYDTANHLHAGYLVHTTGDDQFTVFQGNMFMAKPATDPKIKYENYGAIVRDGWEVD